jgi:uncharacterized protein (TIRG00374 family)
MTVLSLRKSPLVRLLPRILLLLAGMALGVGLIVYLLRSVNLAQLGASFAHVDYLVLALTIPFFAANLLLKVPRWALLFGDEAPGFDTLFGAINVGYSVNALLPARLGDLVRAYWVRERSGLSMVRTLSTIALERVLDGITVLALVLVLAPTVALPPRVRDSAFAAGVLFVLVLAVMIVLAYLSDRENQFTRMLLRLEMGRGAIVAHAVRQIAVGLRALHSGRTVGLVVLYTLAIWGSNCVILWLVVRAFHINAPFAAGVLGTAVVNLAMALPSTPGYLGVFDYFTVVTLGLYGVKRAPAVAAALIFHAIAFIPVTVIGIIYIARAGFQTTAQMVRSAGSPQLPAPPPRREERR